MNAALNIVNGNCLAEAERNEIDVQIDNIISKHKNNRYEVNKLVFQSVSALTASENYSNELASQGAVKRFWGGITGKNRQLQSKVDHSLAAAQYASQQTLQKLAEQNLMSFELITAVNNKLNSSILQVENEINNIYGTLVTFFKRTKSDIIQLENRVERLERNVNLLNWQNSIEYQMYDGIEYSELDDVSKIICLTRDFYDITKAKWTTSDLLLLKAAMASIGISSKDSISYKKFINTVSEKRELIEKLFAGIAVAGMEEYPEYVAVSAGIQKRQLLDTEEKYLVDNTVQMMKKYGCEVPLAVVRDEMLDSFERGRAQIDLNSEVNCYDFILEILYNLEQIKEIQYVKTLDDKLKEAEMLFSVYETEKLIPLLNELVDYGYVKAKYMLALLYETGCAGLERDDEKFLELIAECVRENYSLAVVRENISFNREIESNEQTAEIIKGVLGNLYDLMHQGDSFAAYEYGRCCLNFNWIQGTEADYKLAIEMFNKGPLVLRYFGLARRYDYGQGVEKDYQKSFELYQKSASFGYNPAEYEVGRALQNGWGCEKNEKEAFNYYVRAKEHGNFNAYNCLGNCYVNGWGVEVNDELGIKLFLEGAAKGEVAATDNVGWAYENGRGVSKDYMKAIDWFKKSDTGYSNRHLGYIYLNGKGVSVDKELAKQYFQKAADMGDEEAKKALQENF